MSNLTQDDSNSVTFTSANRLDYELLCKNVLFLIFGGIAVIGNAIVIAVAVKYPSLKKEIDCIFIVSFLAIADGFTGVGSIVAGISRLVVQFLRPSFSRAVCLGLSVPMSVGMYWGQLMIACVAFDRVRALWHPVKYFNLTSEDHFKFALKSFIFSTGSAVLFVAVYFIGVDLDSIPKTCNAAGSVTQIYRGFYILFSYSIAIVVLVLYALVLIALNKKPPDVLATDANADLLAQRMKQMRHATKVLSVVLAAYVIFWVIPNSGMISAALLGGDGKFFGRMGPYAALGAVISSALNIFIYSLRITAFRECCGKFFKGQPDTVSAGTLMYP